MRRREFITLLGGATTWPLAARAQQGERIRRIGVLMATAATDQESQTRNAAFLQGLAQAGWSVGHNLRIEYRWAAGDVREARRHAAELSALAPDVILCSGAASAAAMLQATRSIPIVFVLVPDPVGAGYVKSLGRPGGNATGFTPFEFAIGAKWLELLKEIAPSVSRAGVLRDPNISAGIGQWAAIQAVAPSIRIEVTPIDVLDANEIERAIEAFVGSPNGGLIVTGSASAASHRDLIVRLAARYKLPTAYYERFFIHSGGLISYGPDLTDQFRKAASYVDQILKGAKPADLPVQAPTRYEMLINLKTATTLGLEVPPTLLARADEVIE
jgi:putative ABC transport system substrate-binding protein